MSRSFFLTLAAALLLAAPVSAQEPEEVGPRQGRAGSLCPPSVRVEAGDQGAGGRSEALASGGFRRGDGACLTGRCLPGFPFPGLEGRVEDFAGRRLRRQFQSLQDDLDKLKTEFQPSLGTPGAPVVLVAFSDFECPHCKDEATMLRQNLLSAYPTQVRLYFKDFPLEAIHPWAKTAAIAGRCVFRQSASLVLELSRLDLRAPGRHHCREPEGQGDGVGQGRERHRCFAAWPVHGHQGDRSRGGQEHGRGPRARKSLGLPRCSSTGAGSPR